MSKNIIGYKSQKEKIKRLTERIEKVNMSKTCQTEQIKTLRKKICQMEAELQKNNLNLQACFKELALRDAKIGRQKDVLKLCHTYISESPVFYFDVKDELENEIITQD